MLLGLASALCTPLANGQAFEGLVMPGKVIAGHAKIEMQCDKCHTKFKKSDQRRLCLDCHKPVAEDLKANRGFHSLSPTVKDKECNVCHTDHKGRDADVAPVDSKAFDHAHTDFALKGAHQKAECSACHAAKIKYRDAPLTCIGCHKKDDKHKGDLGNKCVDCHNENTWKEVKFDHSKTRFALVGKHDTAKCEACHANERYKNTPRTCIGCHKKDDNHKGRYGEKCETCHHAEDWKSQFNHARQARYPLLGKHLTAKCDACHRAPLYTEKLPTRCVACHLKDDSHKGSLGDKCETCHKEIGWTKTNFDHNKETKFPLYNKHKSTPCGSCHKTGLKAKLPTTCIECHRADDSHKGDYGKACDSCHNDKGWKPSIFDHTKSTKFPLKFSHASAKCEGCHKGTLYVKDGGKAAPQNCNACHKNDDAHQGQLGERCETCHDERKWPGVVYDHNKSRFKLVGAHARSECKSCHKTPKFKDAPMVCGGCHTADDLHKGRMGGKCDLCHNSRTWKAWDYDHARQARFPLDGAHAKITCEACHRKAASGSSEPIPAVPRNCVGCHAADDTHSGGFGQQCERCHVTRDWRTLKPGIIQNIPQPSKLK
ncbi:MAG: cytochrome C [Betaproteobacteria bacterium]|nr:cytochrome C [Betaproteobacteria bacterium]